MLVAQGNLAAALDSYKASLGIFEKLAKADPGNTGWQHDVSIAHNKIGHVLATPDDDPTLIEAVAVGAGWDVHQMLV